MPKDYDITTIREAVKGSRGFYSVIADRLGCEWHTAKKYVEMHEETKQMHINEDEANIDNSESKLFEKINGVEVTTGKFDAEGNEITYTLPPSDAAIMFHLKTKGKKRGYIERTEIDQTGKPQIILQDVSKNAD